MRIKECCEYLMHLSSMLNIHIKEEKKIAVMDLVLMLSFHNYCQ